MSVMKPWDNIVVEDCENAFAVKLWGRKYTFDGSLFPTSIISQGEELLAEPIALDMEFASEKKRIYGVNHTVIEQSDERVAVCCSALCDNIVLNVSTTIEYDGYIHIAVRLVPCGIFDYITDRKDKKDLTPRLNRAELVIRLRRAESGLFHYWPNTDSSVLVRDVINSGEFFEGELPFKPCLWLGNEERGLNICMESDKNFEVADVQRCIKTSVGDGYNEIRITLLDRVPKRWEGRTENWLAPLEPISYEIMLEATPVKRPTDEALDMWRAYQVYDFELDIDKLHREGVRWVIFHEDWALMQNFGIAANEKKLRDAIDKCHALGMKVMLYFGYEYSSAMTDFEKNSGSYLNRDLSGHPTGGWTRQGTYQKAFVACYNGGYSEEMIAAAAGAMDKYGADGIYTDGTYVPWECANESHGCGYRDDDGVLHLTFPIKAVRNHVKKLYAEVHRRGGVIDTHQSACCLMPTLAFADSYFDGENIQTSFGKQFDEANLTQPLDLAPFRCEYMGRNFGIIPNFISYVNPPKTTMRNVLSITLIHGVVGRPSNRVGTLEPVAEVWRAYDRFGIRDARECPYWEGNSCVKCENENVRITSYEKDSGLLVAVSKFSDVAKAETLSLPARFTKAHEIFDDKEYDIVDGKLSLDMATAQAYMLEIK